MSGAAKRLALDTARPDSNQIVLSPFMPAHAPVVARWVRSNLELYWLAPSSPPPLTPEKVLAWKKPHGEALIARTDRDPTPFGYAEMNPMRRCPLHFWLGHILLAPGHRGLGFGSAFVRALLNRAFDELRAVRVSLVVFPENAPAIRCYERIGFTLVGEEHHRFNETGPKHRLLRWEVSPPQRDEPMRVSRRQSVNARSSARCRAERPMQTVVAGE